MTRLIDSFLRRPDIEPLIERRRAETGDPTDADIVDELGYLVEDPTND
jgi:hypothetical protein